MNMKIYIVAIEQNGVRQDRVKNLKEAEATAEKRSDALKVFCVVDNPSGNLPDIFKKRKNDRYICTVK